jgi:2',3'-cyclic-nucleotide 2'-phosphodiesterase (5'-nucleotidase family)
MKATQYFIRKSVFLILLALLQAAFGLTAYAETQTHSKNRSGSDAIQCTILFFNDIHGHLKPFSAKEQGQKTEVGGIARMATLVQKIRTENNRKSIPTFCLLAGDILQGPPMSTVFKGEPDVKCFNLMGINAMTVGNHEFDFGLDNLIKLRDVATFPFLSANIVLKDTGKTLFRPMVAMPLAPGIDLNVIGVTTNDLLFTTHPKNTTDISVQDPVKAVQEIYQAVEGKGPVILLSHNKAAEDKTIAERLPGLLAIIGGHDQILLNPPKMEGSVPVFQAFEKGKYLGRIDLIVDPVTRRGEITGWSYTAITPEIPENTDVAAIVKEYDNQLGIKFHEVIGETSVYLNGDRGTVRYQETNMGNLITDIMKNFSGSDIALLNAGSIRSGIDIGPITLEEVYTAFPFENELMVVNISGEDLLAALSRAVKGRRADEDGGFLHISGLTFKIKNATPQDILINGLPLDPAATYRTAVSDFIAGGGDGYTLFRDKIPYRSGSMIRELVVQAIRNQKTISPATDGRIQRLDETDSGD